MKCPYCAEDIKDEAIVCRHCHRDLTLFKPFDERLKTIESELASLTECVAKMSAFLDRQQIGESTDTGDDRGTPTKLKKPTFWRKLLVALLQFGMSLALIIGFSLIADDRAPEVPRVNAYQDYQTYELALDRYETERVASTQPLLRTLVALLFALPIGLGVWIGYRWRGRNLKHYLITALLCGLTNNIVFVFLLIVVALDPGPRPRGIVSQILLIIGIDLLRCIFGFATGGLIGDWIERRKYPQLYGKRFSDALESSRRKRAHGFDRLTLGFGKFATSIAPLVPLVGVLITSSVGFYTAQQAWKREIAKETKKDPPQATASPTP